MSLLFLSVGASASGNPSPVIGDISPSQILVGNAEWTVLVSGSNFIDGCVARINGNDRLTTFLNGDEIEVYLPGSDIQTVGTLNITVTNPDGVTSNNQDVMVVNSLQSVTAITPSTTLAGNAGFDLAVSGAGFTPTCIVYLNGSRRSTRFVNEHQLIASVSNGDLAVGGLLGVTVADVATSGGRSNSVDLVVNNPVPLLSIISGTTMARSYYLLSVKGSNFNQSTVVRVNGIDQITLFQNSTLLNIDVRDIDVISKPLRISTSNPVPGGGESEVRTYSMAIPIQLEGITPSLQVAGSQGFTMELSGSNFTETSTVQFDDQPRSTVYVNSGKLLASISANDVQRVGQHAISVHMQALDGWKSNSLPFLVTKPKIINPSKFPAPSSARLPDMFSLNQNYPNPFNPTTTIQFDLPNPSIVTVKIYNALGREVATLVDHETMDKGRPEVEFNAANLASGIYFYKIVAQQLNNDDHRTLVEQFSSVKKMMLIK
ncbi:MAG: T9SS type A sorting domain-containing protein [Bacteroidetes bacterium]|nr:T9SS type A sorting domain-containing protein [Bacteroidota bacterium]